MNCSMHVEGHRTFKLPHCVDGNKLVNLIENMYMYVVAVEWNSNGHVVAAIFEESGKLENYVGEIFSKETFLKAYDWHIYHILGEED
ncbi:hypothetical protein Lalb_Chr20g0117021 [Lupinus albus]|uniref:Uncharacterized protein n=1 Tax=Lupinus albus TaxID=3870 RepID=A0A6A4NX47_LUPAL|nr:hypothetical protein Lalb_Chr20g0117021 [Lupinus albus]